MAKLYRKSALERMASPEQLDKALKVTSPLSWLPLGGVTLIIVVTAIWSVMGRIPVTITTNGIIASPVNTNAVYTENAGTVDSVYVSVGDEIRPGDEVALVEASNGSAYTIESDRHGLGSRHLGRGYGRPGCSCSVCLSGSGIASGGRLLCERGRCEKNFPRHACLCVSEFCRQPEIWTYEGQGHQY